MDEGAEMNEIVSVSAVIPCYRCADTIERAVESVYVQTLRPFEVILVDDFSNDHTLDVLYSLQSKYGKGWVKIIALDKNDGPATARNIGWEASKQDYIAFLDSDDTWHPRKIEIQYGWMIQNPNATLTGHDCVQIKDGLNYPEIHEYSSSDVNFYPVSKTKLLLSNRFPTCTVMVKRGIYQRFPMGKRYSEDYHLWLDIACAGFELYRTDLPLAYLYKGAVGEAGLSASIWKMRKGELDCFTNMYKSRCVGSLTYGALMSYSAIKLIRLFLILGFRRLVYRYPFNRP